MVDDTEERPGDTATTDAAEGEPAAVAIPVVLVTSRTVRPLRLRPLELGPEDEDSDSGYWLMSALMIQKLTSDALPVPTLPVF